MKRLVNLRYDNDVNYLKWYIGKKLEKTNSFSDLWDIKWFNINDIGFYNKEDKGVKEKKFEKKLVVSFLDVVSI